MDFDLRDLQITWRDRAAVLGREVARDALRLGSGHPERESRGVAASTVVQGAARFGLLDPAIDLLTLAVAIEALAGESPTAAVVLALHSSTALALVGHARVSGLFRGETVAAVGLSSDEVPIEQGGRLAGRAPWVAPITDRGVAVVGPWHGTERVAYVVPLDALGVTVVPVATAALAGVECGHVSFNGAPCEPIGATVPIMTRIRILMAAVGLGMGRRALREALATAKGARTATAGEQTVQGLLADAATELDAAMLMTWKAASAAPPSLGDASLAKLMATAAAQRAVDRATQVIGVDSFQRGHILERLAQDVRALELFAGRTEALRAAAAEEILPPA
jgi:alkylation response protein AidB-like acyl-CoA dehydrogenase